MCHMLTQIPFVMHCILFQHFVQSSKKQNNVSLLVYIKIYKIGSGKTQNKDNQVRNDQTSYHLKTNPDRKKSALVWRDGPTAHCKTKT